MESDAQFWLQLIQALNRADAAVATASFSRVE